MNVVGAHNIQHEKTREVLIHPLTMLVNYVQRLEAKIDKMQIHNYIELLNQNMDARFKRLELQQQMWSTSFTTLHTRMCRLQIDVDSIIEAVDDFILRFTEEDESEVDSSPSSVHEFPPTPSAFM